MLAAATGRLRPGSIFESHLPNALRTPDTAESRQRPGARAPPPLARLTHRARRPGRPPPRRSGAAEKRRAGRAQPRARPPGPAPLHCMYLQPPALPAPGPRAALRRTAAPPSTSATSTKASRAGRLTRARPGPAAPGRPLASVRAPRRVTSHSDTPPPFGATRVTWELPGVTCVGGPPWSLEYEIRNHTPARQVPSTHALDTSRTCADGPGHARAPKCGPARSLDLSPACRCSGAPARRGRLARRALIAPTRATPALGRGEGHARSGGQPPLRGRRPRARLHARHTAVGGAAQPTANYWRQAARAYAAPCALLCGPRPLVGAAAPPNTPCTCCQRRPRTSARTRPWWRGAPLDQRAFDQ